MENASTVPVTTPTKPTTPKPVLVIFGGLSSQHEASIVTGLQILENIDRLQYVPFAIYISEKGEYQLLPNLNNRNQFAKIKHKKIVWGADEFGGFVETRGFFPTRIHPIVAIIAMHGGVAEAGSMAGMLDMLRIPYTSPNVEPSVLFMNKALTKEILMQYKLPVVGGLSLLASQIDTDVNQMADYVKATLGLPVIAKPAHQGGSAGISVVQTEAELVPALQAASKLDTEVVVEQYLGQTAEYNVAVRLAGGQLQTSDIQRITRKQDPADPQNILTEKQVPALLANDLAAKLEVLAKETYIACRAKGNVQIDILVVNDTDPYVLEVNPIPPNFAMELWLNKGLSLSQLISDSISQAFAAVDYANTKQTIPMKADLVKFMAEAVKAK